MLSRPPSSSKPPHEPQTFHPPHGLDEAETRRINVLSDIKSIEVQLGDKQKVNPLTKERMTEQEYFDWRAKSTRALKAKETELRHLNKWIKDYHRLHALTPPRTRKEE
jgi:hypothetical protein